MLYRLRRLNDPAKSDQFASSVHEHVTIMRHVDGYAGIYVGHVVDTETGADFWHVYHGGDKASIVDPMIAIIDMYPEHVKPVHDVPRSVLRRGKTPINDLMGWTRIICGK